MIKPRIGMIPSLSDDNPERQHPSKGCIEAVARAGGEVVVIDRNMAHKEQDSLLLTMDALLFQGGGDMHPSYFDEEIHPNCGTIDLQRDELELRAFALLFPKNVPMLGICRGAQVMNIALGGSLYQDLPSQLGVSHSLGEPPLPEHIVYIEPNSKLRDIVQADRFATNSLHHQSIKATGRGLIVCARTEDGVIEAIELPGPQFFLGLQWHPEITLDDDRFSMSPFQAFINSI